MHQRHRRSHCQPRHTPDQRDQSPEDPFSPPRDVTCHIQQIGQGRFAFCMSARALGFQPWHEQCNRDGKGAKHPEHDLHLHTAWACDQRLRLGLVWGLAITGRDVDQKGARKGVRREKDAHGEACRGV